MSNLESIVPPVELCKQIPAGEFEDSALVWCRVRGEDVVCQREHWVGVFGMSPVPAPTLEEIINKLPHEYEEGRFCVWDNGIEYDTHDGWLIEDTNFCNEPDGFAAAALRLWFKVKGIQCE